MNIKIIKNTLYFYFFYQVFEIWTVFCNYSTTAVGLSLISVLNSHTGLKANVFDSITFPHLWKITNPLFLLQGPLSAFDFFIHSGNV